MKKIMFNDKYGLTQAVLEGRKTMTRREIPVNLYNAIDFGTLDDGDNCCVYSNGDWYNIFDCVPYKVGEIVAIAQSYKDCGNTILKKWGHSTDIALLGLKKLAGWNNKMFVKAELMPHHIRITDIRVERLQDISDDDCMREGVRLRSEPSKYQEVWSPEYTFGNGKYHAKYPRAAFVAIIDKVSGKGTWDRNPYVFVYEFELVD